jgi:DUF4097 and DUF4098 domain-containing protein YvlB
MRQTLLLLPCLFAACSYPRFSASTSVEAEISADQIKELRCHSHNGGITVTGNPASTSIMVQVTMAVRGHTQQEADDNLKLLKMAQERKGGTLRIFGEYPKMQLNGRSPSFAFTVSVPERLALRLDSHNGNISTSGTGGNLRIETHNGDVDAAIANTRCNIETHNGRITATIDAPGPLDSRITSHNGDIKIGLHQDANGWLEASSHNGSIDPPSRIIDATIKRRSLRCRIGDEKTNGLLKISTHNGDISVR